MVAAGGEIPQRPHAEDVDAEGRPTPCRRPVTMGPTQAVTATDDEVVVLCEHGHSGCPPSRAIADGIGLGEDHWSRQHCEGSRR